MSKYVDGDIVFLNKKYSIIHRNEFGFRIKHENENGDSTLNSRPFFLVHDPKDVNIFWAIPFTSQIEKFKEIDQLGREGKLEGNISNLYEKTKDKWYCRLNGKMNVAMLSHATPCLEDDIQQRYMNCGKGVYLSYSDKNGIIKRFSNEIEYLFHGKEKDFGYISRKIYYETAAFSRQKNYVELDSLISDIYDCKKGNGISFVDEKTNSAFINQDSFAVGKMFEYKNELYQIRSKFVTKGSSEMKVDAILFNMDRNEFSLQNDWCNGDEFSIDNTYKAFGNNKGLITLKEIHKKKVEDFLKLEKTNEMESDNFLEL